MAECARRSRQAPSARLSWPLPCSMSTTLVATAPTVHAVMFTAPDHVSATVITTLPIFCCVSTYRYASTISSSG